MPIIGAHVSSAGGLNKSIKNGEDLGVESIQIFGASPRQWKASLPSDKDVKDFLIARKESNIKSIFLHAAYLVNVASPDEDIWNKSIENLSKHYQIADMIKADGLIFHVGSAKGSDKKEAEGRMIKGIKNVLKNVLTDKTFLIMENTAGGGDKLGTNLEDFGQIIKGVDSTRIGACFDTAHALAGGTIEEYTPSNIEELFNNWEKYIGIDKLMVIHANDSKTEFNSNSDRHENIGEGFIGKKGFENLAKEKRIKKLPWILEVPGFDNHGPDKKNVDILKSLVLK